MPNIHTEYHFEEGVSTLSSNIKRAIAIQDYSFFFIAYSSEKVIYALHAGLNPENHHQGIKELKEYLIGKFGNEVLNDCYMQILSPRFTLIPEGLFNKSDYASALDYIYPEQIDHTILDSAIEKINSVLVADGSSPIFSAQSELINAKNTEDFAAAWLNKVLSVNSGGAYIHVLSHSFLVAIVFDGKLQLFNKFDFAAKNDFMYFLLGSIQCTGLKNENLTLYLSGEISSSSPLMEQVSYYFADVKFLQERFDEHPESSKISHQFYTLIEK